MYPVVFFDALRVKIRDDAVVRNKAVYLVLAVLPDGTHWDTKYPTIAQSWRRAWQNVIPFFAFPPEVRRVIGGMKITSGRYVPSPPATNVIESLHMQLRKIIKTVGTSRTTLPQSN